VVEKLSGQGQAGKKKLARIRRSVDAVAAAGKASAPVLE
jgi:hypothetical protein